MECYRINSRRRRCDLKDILGWDYGCYGCYGCYEYEDEDESEHADGGPESERHRLIELACLVSPEPATFVSHALRPYFARVSLM